MVDIEGTKEKYNGKLPFTEPLIFARGLHVTTLHVSSKFFNFTWNEFEVSSSQVHTICIQRAGIQGVSNSKLSYESTLSIYNSS